MNKFEFIQKLLENEKFTTSQKDRFFRLVSKELEKSDDIKISDLKKDVLLIKEKLGIIDSSINKKETDDEVEMPKYYSPIDTYKFLFNYNQNTILKSTCHDIDSDELSIINKYCESDTYNFNNHLHKIIEAYNLHEKKHFAPSSLKTLFRVYLTGKNYKGDVIKGWSSDFIQINWSAHLLEEWANVNISIPPNLNEGLVEEYENTGFEFPSINSKITGQYIQSFDQLVIHFKHLWHIRSDNSLRAIIDRKNKLELWEDKIDFIIEENLFPVNIEHFTDIDKLVQAYKKIILLALEVANKNALDKPIIKLSAAVDLEKFQFSIHHMNTEYKKSISNTIERLGKNYRSLVIKQINGLCDFYINADFGNEGHAKINIWNGKNRSKETLRNFVGGVEHLLVFPKK